MRYILLLLIIALFSSCKEKKEVFYTEKEFEEYISDPVNGHIYSTSLGELLVSMKFVPAYNGNANYTINLRLERKDGKPVLDMNNSLQDNVSSKESYLSFGILNDLYLVDDDKIHHAIFHHYERNYSLKPSVDIFFEFEQFKPKNEVRVVFKDQIFDQGMCQIKIDKNLLNEYKIEK